MFPKYFRLGIFHAVLNFPLCESSINQEGGGSVVLRQQKYQISIQEKAFFSPFYLISEMDASCFQ